LSQVLFLHILNLGWDSVCLILMNYLEPQAFQTQSA